MHSASSTKELTKSIKASAEGGYQISAGLYLVNLQAFLTQVLKAVTILSWSNVFIHYTDYDQSVRDWEDMTSFINKLDRTLTKEQFVEKYGCYVPTGFSKGCSVVHRIILTCSTGQATKTIESGITAKLDRTSYTTDFTATFQNIMKNMKETCKVTGRAKMSPEGLLSKTLIYDITETDEFRLELNSLSEKCKQLGEKKQNIVCIQYLPRK